VGLGWELSLIKALQAIANPFLDALFMALGELGGDVIWLMVIFAFLALGRRREGLGLAFLVLTGFYTSYSLKYAIGRPRPPVGLQRYGGPRTDPSMPSTHATEAASNLGFLASRAKNKKAYLACSILALLAGLSRVYFGLHWPTDVLAGLALGLALLAFYASLIEGLLRPRLMALWARRYRLVPLAILTGVLLALITPSYWGRPPTYIGGLVAGLFSGSLLARAGKKDHRDLVNIFKTVLSCSVGLAGLAISYALLSGPAQFLGAMLTGLWASWIGPRVLWRPDVGGQRRSVGSHSPLIRAR